MFKAQENLIPCQPPIWAKVSHLHTIAAYLMTSPRARTYDEKLLIPVSDGDQLVSFYYRGNKNISIYLFHGLSGDTQSSYMQRTCNLAQSLGAHVYMTNHRGCGEGEGLAGEPYHSGRSDDLGWVIEAGRKRNPDHLHLAIGFSLSGNAVLLLGAGIRSNNLPDAIISVNPPIQLEKAAQRLGKGLNLVYDQKFVAELVRAVQVREVKNSTPNKYVFPRVLSTYRFDEIYTGPAAGFGTRENYYKTCSAKQYLSEIKVPTLILTSKDDPFVDFMDFENAPTSSAVQIQIQKFGGHLGYLNRVPLPAGGKRWLDYFLSEQISHLMRAL